MTVLFGWPQAFGCRSPSPYVMKSMIHLDMLGVDYTMQIADLAEAPYKKAPYVKDDGQLIADSTFIRKYFEEKLGKDLDASLTPQQRTVAWSLGRMIESDMGIMMLHERWHKEENFNRGPIQFFAGVPEEARAHVIDSVLSGMRDRLDRHGISRFGEAERVVMFEEAVRAVSDVLGENDYMFGKEATGLDAIVAAFVQGCGTEFFDTPMVDVIRKYENLTALTARVDERFFNTERWAR